MRPEPGGEHADFGTHNVLLSLGSAYLEVIAINPQAPAPPRPRWFELDTPEMQERLSHGPALIHWVAAVGEPLTGRPDVQELSRGANRWQLTVAGEGRLPMGGVAPSLIHWHTPPPAALLPNAGVRLLTLFLGTPQPEGLRGFLSQIGFAGEVEVYEALQAELHARLETPRGLVEL